MAIIRYCNKMQSIWEFNCSIQFYKKKLDLTFTQSLEVCKDMLFVWFGSFTHFSIQEYCLQSFSFKLKEGRFMLRKLITAHNYILEDFVE